MNKLAILMTVAAITASVFWPAPSHCEDAPRILTFGDDLIAWPPAQSACDDLRPLLAEHLYQSYRPYKHFLPPYVDSTFLSWMVLDSTHKPTKTPVKFALAMVNEYVLDSGVTGSGTWTLRTVQTENSLIKDPKASFFQFGDSCGPCWVGPAPRNLLPHLNFAIAVRGRFIRYDSVEDEGRGIPALIEAFGGSSASVGDTVYITMPLADLEGDPSCKEALQRFNRAIEAIGIDAADVGHRRIIDLYLKSVFPYKVLILIEDPKELDALRLLYEASVDAWIEGKTLSLPTQVREGLLRPGVRSGVFLRDLPTPYPLRSQQPLPSQLLAASDSGWFPTDSWDSAITPGDDTVISNLLLSQGLLIQVAFGFSSFTGRLTNVQIIRMADLWD